MIEYDKKANEAILEAIENTTDERLKADLRAIYRITPLLAFFDAQLASYGPGVCAYDKRAPITRYGDFGRMSFDAIVWSWLEPLLQELKARRESDASSG